VNFATPIGQWRSEEWLATTRSALMQIEIGDTARMPEGPEESLLEYLGRAGPTVSNIASLVLIYEFRQLYGAGVARAYRHLLRFQSALTSFQDRFGPGPVVILRAPARINIVGEHVDYVPYFPTEVLAFGSRQHDMLMLFRPRSDNTIRAASSLPSAAPAHFDFAEFRALGRNGENSERVWLEYLQKLGVPPRHWTNYVKGAVGYACAKYGPRVQRGFDFFIDSTIPSAGGASSSSALCTLAGAAIRMANHVPFSPEELADDSSRAEWYIGTRGGKMDHTVICLSDRQSAINIHFQPFHVRTVRLHRYRFRWVTCHAHEADKSGAVMCEYNERAATSCMLIPALLERCFEQEPELRRDWDEAIGRMGRDYDDLTVFDDLARIIQRLPEEIHLAKVQGEFPRVYEQLAVRYPMLIERAETEDVVFKVRSRAAHHIGEIRRVRETVQVFDRLFSSGEPEYPERIEPGLRHIGELMAETHKSMASLYDLSTPDVEELVHTVLSVPGVYGARLMGGGFGGNVLVLTQKDSLDRLLEVVQEKYYGPRDRDWAEEDAVMISTPGRGLYVFDDQEQLRRVVLTGATAWWKWSANEQAVMCAGRRLVRIGSNEQFRPSKPVRLVLVAGGKGGAERPDGSEQPKPLVEVAGVPCFRRVLNAFDRLPFKLEPPIIVVGPHTAESIRRQLGPRFEGHIIVQETPLGTGHAALLAAEAIDSFDGVAAVVWAVQPLLQTRTILRSLLIHQALEFPLMSFPTAVTEHPYAPIDRDASGHVVASSETYLEGARVRAVGETNIGMFLLDAKRMLEILSAIHAEAWDPVAKRYARPKGELGFPNEMVRALSRRGTPAVALPLAEPFEPLGIRTMQDAKEAECILSAEKTCE